MLGRSLISLTSMIFCFLRASFFFFCSLFLYFPKSRILQTGGSALGAISTRSRPASEAIVSASLRPTTPTMLPRSSTRRTRMTAISSLIRGPSRVGVKFIGGLAMCNLLFRLKAHLPAAPAPLRRRWYRRFLLQSSNGFAERKDFLLVTSEAPHRDGPVGRLSPPDNQHDRHLGEAMLSNLIVDFFVSGIEDNSHPSG